MLSYGQKVCVENDGRNNENDKTNECSGQRGRMKK